LRWRRISFIHTTWDRFEAAEEINDLFIESDQFVDRLYHALRDSGLSPERQYPIHEAGAEYVAALAVPCRDGVVAMDVTGGESGCAALLCFSPEAISRDLEGCLASVQQAIGQRGGIQPGGIVC
jgi:hypothetical protein